MNRREAVQYISVLLGGTILGAEAFIGCKSGDKGSSVAFSQEDVAFLDEVADTILPTTKTPGAKAAKVGEHMRVMVTDCYEPADQKIFRDGMNDLQERAKKNFDKDFMELNQQQRLEILNKLDAEQKETMKTLKSGDPKPYFRLMKELTLLGYFTSEIGCTQARRYIETPGKWEACIPYQKGDRAWA